MNIKGRVKSITAALEKKRQQLENKLFAIAENDRYVAEWVGKIAARCASKGYMDLTQSEWTWEELFACGKTDDELGGFLTEYFKRIDELRQQIKKEMGM